MKEINKKHLNDEMQLNCTDFAEGIMTRRNSMHTANRSNSVLDDIIELKARTRMLPITMRKVYAYKIASIKAKIREKKIIPLVLRKRMLYECVVNG